MSNIYMEIINSNDKKAYTPVLEGELYIETYRSSIPSKACFNVIKDSIIDFSEGSTVKIYADSIPIFWGYVFTKTRNKEGIISVTAYDQLRYLKNKATYNFNGFTVSGIIKQIASDYMINCGSIEDSGFIINNMTSDEKTLFDIIQSAIDTTYLSTGNLYVLFDDFGKLSLKKAENMASNYIVKDDTAEDLSYTSSIDSNTFNQIRLTLKGKKGIVQEYFKKNDDSVSKWGVLQYTGSIEEGEDGNAKALSILNTHSMAQRSLSISGAFGDINVRAGSIIYVRTDKTGDIIIDEAMTVESCRHRFKMGVHTMDLSLRGGLINS